MQKNAKIFYRISQTAFFSRNLIFIIFFEFFLTKCEIFCEKKFAKNAKVSLYNFLISLLKTESNISLKRIFVLIFLHNAKQKVDFKTDIKSGMTFLDNFLLHFHLYIERWIGQEYDLHMQKLSLIQYYH